MLIDHLMNAAPASAPSRRRFLTLSVGGLTGLALAPFAPLGALAQAPKKAPGQNATEQPAAFVHIAADGKTTILCNRMDMGQGIETALAMACAED